MKKLAVLTTSRADYSCLRPILSQAFSSPEIKCSLIVAGTHLSERHGDSVKEIEADGFPIASRVEVPMVDDTPLGVARSAGLSLNLLAESLYGIRPDTLLILGDRFEVQAGASAAACLTIPVSHIHGGELTEGAMDDAFRHSITKLSHLHFVATQTYRRRVIQMGEEPWRVTVSGAPSLDNLRTFKPLTRDRLEAVLGLPIKDDPLLITYHPTTLGDSDGDLTAILEALNSHSGPMVFTAPNADPGNDSIRKKIRTFVANHEEAVMVENLGPVPYFSLLSIAWAMLGNSSSGIIEAPSFALPVINVGDRQKGRIRADNVVDVHGSKSAIEEALEKVSNQRFKDEMANLQNPYGDGHAAQRIIDVIAGTAKDDRLIKKKFVDLNVEDIECSIY